MIRMTLLLFRLYLLVSTAVDHQIIWRTVTRSVDRLPFCMVSTQIAKT